MRRDVGDEVELAVIRFEPLDDERPELSHQVVDPPMEDADVPLRDVPTGQAYMRPSRHSFPRSGIRGTPRYGGRWLTSMARPVYSRRLSLGPSPYSVLPMFRSPGRLLPALVLLPNDEA